MTIIDQIAERVSQLQVEMERRFGQIRTILLLLSCALVLSIGPQTLLGQLLSDLVIYR